MREPFRAENTDAAANTDKSGMHKGMDGAQC